MAFRGFIKKITQITDDFQIRTKFYALYFLCVLLPLVLTNVLMVFNVVNLEKESAYIEMENTAESVISLLSTSVEVADNFGVNIYRNSYVNDFLMTDFESDLDFLESYQEFFKDTLLSNGFGLNLFSFQMYVDNPTILDGGYFKKLQSARDMKWYRSYRNSLRSTHLYFDYDDFNVPGVSPKRKILFIRNLDFYKRDPYEKLLKVDLDYSTVFSEFLNMHCKFPVYVCSNDNILLDNTGISNIGKDYPIFMNKEDVAFSKSDVIYGCPIVVYILKTPLVFRHLINRFGLLFLILLILDIFLPTFFMLVLNHSFTARIASLTKTITSVKGDYMALVPNPNGKDEIGTLMRSYNRLVMRLHNLIQTVYKSKIKEQESIVARQNAELHALHGQINPHFLFNALESIRMHSVLKHEDETAEMVERLALMQRHYVDWGSDFIKIEKEMEFIKAYLELQKYRFGDRLFYDFDIDKTCLDINIPKLTIVTFVENACVHGVESKTTACWIFVRAKIIKNILEIEIEDTGAGMSESKRLELLKKMSSANIDMLEKNGRVGILNACLRVKIASHNKAKFDLYSEEGAGTTFTIRVPVSLIGERNE